MGVAELDPTSSTLTIHSVFFFYGNSASDQLSRDIANDIQTHWNEPRAFVKIKNNPFKVKFKIEGIWAKNLTEHIVISNTNPYHNFFRIEEKLKGNISFVDDIGSNTGVFQLDNLLNNSTTAAHEYGHTIGLHHPEQLDIRGFGKPAIMYPRGTLVDPEFQYDATKPAGVPGGTINPFTRVVMQEDIDDLRLGRLEFISGKAVLGKFTNEWHEIE